MDRLVKFEGANWLKWIHIVTPLQRSMFVVIGDKARDQTVKLHHMLSKAQVKARPSVLWCNKEELRFSRKQCDKIDFKEDNPFELFVASTTFIIAIIMKHTKSMVIHLVC